MNKAENFEDFKRALNIMGIPRFNIVYADKQDNIFYMSNALIPFRDTIYNWELTLQEILPKQKPEDIMLIRIFQN